jgi:hypothetical protein
MQEYDESFFRAKANKRAGITWLALIFIATIYYGIKTKNGEIARGYFIAFTIIAIGTSLPELVTSITATRKGDSGLALGNAIGSNLFNILFILGMSATICPLNVLSESIIDCIILLVSAVILYVFARTKKTMNRWEGIVCVFLYVGYTAYLLIR